MVDHICPFNGGGGVELADERRLDTKNKTFANRHVQPTLKQIRILFAPNWSHRT